MPQAAVRFALLTAFAAAATLLALPPPAAAASFCLAARMPAAEGDRLLREFALRLDEAGPDEGGVFTGEARLKLSGGGPQDADVGRIECGRAAVGFACRLELDGAVGRFWLEPEEVSYRLTWDHLPARRGERLTAGFAADRVLTLEREDRPRCP